MVEPCWVYSFKLKTDSLSKLTLTVNLLIYLLEEDDLPVSDSGEPDSVDDMIDFKRTPTDRPSEPTPTAFEKNEQQFFAPSPKVTYQKNIWTND